MWLASHEDMANESTLIIYSPIIRLLNIQARLKESGVLIGRRPKFEESNARNDAILHLFFGSGIKIKRQRRLNVCRCREVFDS